MNKIKRAFYIIVGVIVSTTPFSVRADLIPATGFDIADVNATDAGITNTTVFDLVANAMNWLLGLTGVLAVVAFVISGIMYITSPGDQEQAEKAKSVMIYAIIGLVVAFVGLIVVNAISGLTGAGGVGRFY